MAVLHFINRLADCVEKDGIYAAEEQRAHAYVCKCLRNIAKNPPGNLYEALQLSYIFHELMEMEGELVRSMGALTGCTTVIILMILSAVFLRKNG